MPLFIWLNENFPNDWHNDVMDEHVAIVFYYFFTGAFVGAGVLGVAVPCEPAPKPGVVLGFVVCVSVAAFSRTLVSVTDLGATYAHTTLNTTMAIANPHVAFSTTSVVLRTPMIEFDEENCDERPPPFDS